MTLPPTALRSAENEAPIGARQHRNEALIGAKNQAPGYTGNQPPRDITNTRQKAEPTPVQHRTVSRSQPAPKTPESRAQANTRAGGQASPLCQTPETGPQDSPGGRESHPKTARVCQTRRPGYPAPFSAKNRGPQAHLCRENRAQNQRHTSEYKSYLFPRTGTPPGPPPVSHAKIKT